MAREEYLEDLRLIAKNEIVAILARQTPYVEITRDIIHNRLSNLIRYNRFDLRFIANIDVKYVRRALPLSENQNELWERLIVKYRKQFKSAGINIADILALDWHKGLVTSESLLQATLLDVDDTGMMRLRFNFNKDMINEVRAIVHDDAREFLKLGTELTGFGSDIKHDFIWDGDLKTWAGPFNTYLFGAVYEFARLHKLNISDSVLALVDEHKGYGTKDDWTPKVRVVHNRMYISCITESMMKLLSPFDLTDVSLYNIEQVTNTFGLDLPDEIDPKLIPFIRSTRSRHKAIEIDVKATGELDTLVEYLNLTNRTVVVLGAGARYDKHAESKLAELQDALKGRVNIISDFDITDLASIAKMDETVDTVISDLSIELLLHNQVSMSTAKFAIDAKKFLVIK